MCRVAWWWRATGLCSETSATKRRGLRRVEVLGRVSEEEKVELLARSWGVLSVAHHEGWGMSMLEGAVFGTPALAVDAPGIRDAVIDGVTGQLVTANNESALPEVFGVPWCRSSTSTVVGPSSALPLACGLRSSAGTARSTAGSGCCSKPRRRNEPETRFAVTMIQFVAGGV